METNNDNPMSASEAVVYILCSVGASSGPSAGDPGCVSAFLPLIVDPGWPVGSFHHCEMGPEGWQGLGVRKLVPAHLCGIFANSYHSQVKQLSSVPRRGRWTGQGEQWVARTGRGHMAGSLVLRLSST